MSYSQKYTVVQFLEHVRDQQVFSMDNWPLHITLADVFAVELSQPLIDQLAQLISSKNRVLVSANEDGRLGKDKNSVNVTLIQNNPELQALHNDLVDFLKDQGAVFNSPQYTLEGFLPHSTHQKHAKLHKGDQVSIDKLSLVDMFVDGDWKLRKIMRSFNLQN